MHTFDCWLICIISYIRSVDVDGFRVFVCVFAFGLSIHVSNVFRCLTVVAPCALSLYLSGLVCRTIEFPRFSLFIRNERLLSACQKKKSSSSLRHRHIYTRIIKEKKKHKHLKLYRYRFCLGWNKPHYDQFRREWKHELTRNATRQTLVIMPLQCFFIFVVVQSGWSSAVDSSKDPFLATMCASMTAGLSVLCMYPTRLSPLMTTEIELNCIEMTFTMFFNLYSMSHCTSYTFFRCILFIYTIYIFVHTSHGTQIAFCRSNRCTQISWLPFCATYKTQRLPDVRILMMVVE